MFEDRLAELTPEQRELFQLFLKKERLNLETAGSYRPPSNAVEEALTRIWSDLLGVDPSVDDNYFELGGDSITIIRMVSQARSQGIHLRAEWVFSHPTIATLAALCGRAEPAAPAPRAATAWQDHLACIRDADPDFERTLKRTGATAVDVYPLTPSQQGILFHALDRSCEGSYVAQWRFRVKGKLDVPRLQRAWTQAIARHEAFRTIFQWVGVEEPMQVVLDRAASVIVEEEHDGDWEAQAAAIFDAERRDGFDLRNAPLMRIRLLRVADDEWVCFWTHHHLILDGWSQQTFVEELLTAYRGEPLPPVRPGLFRDYVHGLRSGHDAAAADFWRTQLAGYRLPATRLPARHGGVHSVVTRTVGNAGRLRDALKGAAVTLSVFYQTAWALALSRMLEQSDIVFGVACSGRSSGAAGMQRAVGLFINTLPLRVMVDPAVRLRALLRTVQQQQARMIEQERCGLLSIQNWVGWDRRTPLFESIYVYERFHLDFAELRRTQHLEISDLETTTHEHYPAILVVHDDDDATRLVLKHSALDAAPAHAFADLLDFIASIAERFMTTPDVAVRQLLTDANIRALSGPLSTEPFPVG